MNNQPNSIAFFDFDGTITFKDSLADFLKSAFGVSGFYRGVVAMLPVLMAYKLKLLSNHDAKEKFIAHYFKGWQENQFQQKADDYSEHGIASIVRSDAAEKLAWHKSQGHKIVIVSASIENWLHTWCIKNGFELVGTRLEVENGEITGKFSTRNCYGQEKVNRINSLYSLSEFQEVYAYGDSRGDREMLAIASQPSFRCFTKKFAG